MKKYIYCGVPSHGATLTVYKNLKVILGYFDIELHWVGVGPSANERSERFTDKVIETQGSVIAGDVNDERLQASILKDYIEKSGYNGYIVNVLFDKVQMNLVKYLDNKIIRIMFVHSISNETYHTSSQLKNFVHHTICVSPRIYIDLISKYDFKVNSTTFIPNTLGFDQFLKTKAIRPVKNSKLKILSIGRIENQSKGVFLLPKIFSRLNPNDYLITLAGAGPDKDELLKRLAKLDFKINYTEWVDAENVNELMSDHDILIMPSIYEGFGLTLLEAMISGCVPVATNIRGVTDYVVEDGYSGFLFKKMDSVNAVEIIEKLNKNRTLLNKVSVQAESRALELFTSDLMKHEYGKVFSRIRNSNNKVESLPFEYWAYDKTWLRSLKKIVPESVKQYIRYVKS